MIQPPTVRSLERLYLLPHMLQWNGLSSECTSICKFKLLLVNSILQIGHSGFCVNGFSSRLTGYTNRCLQMVHWNGLPADGGFKTFFWFHWFHILILKKYLILWNTAAWEGLKVK